MSRASVRAGRNPAGRFGEEQRAQEHTLETLGRLVKNGRWLETDPFMQTHILQQIQGSQQIGFIENEMKSSISGVICWPP